MAIDDQAGDLVVLVGDHGLVEELLERQVGERHAGCDRLLGTPGGDAGEPVAGPRRGCLRKQVAQVGEHVGGGVDRLAIDHGGSGQWRTNDNAKLSFGYDRPVTAARASRRAWCNLWHARSVPDARAMVAATLAVRETQLFDSKSKNLSPRWSHNARALRKNP